VAAPKVVAAAPPGQRVMVQGGFAPPPVAGVVQMKPSFVAASTTQPGAAVAGTVQQAAMASSATVTAAPVAGMAGGTQPAIAAAPAIAYAPSTPNICTVMLPSNVATVPPASALAKEVAIAPSMQGISIEYAAALERRLADLEIANANKTHSAFVFIKPHAVTESVKQLVKDHLMALPGFILSEGIIHADEIDQQSLIDTHYGAIAAKAVSALPAELIVQPSAQEEFLEVFNISWEEALQQNLVFNAMEAASVLKIRPEELGMKWRGLSKGVDLLKFGGGFYCGQIDGIFVINGFYMDMRAKFTTPGTCIYYFEVEWDARGLSWAEFRHNKLGATDPLTAVEGSIRNTILLNWEALGLQACPDTGDNGVHASASPFEALAERANWLNMSIESDFFGKALMASGLPLPMIEEWCKDPAVHFEGKKQSLFDLLEDRDSRDCLRRAADIAAENV